MIRNNVGSLINSGGTSADSLGSSSLDFTYVLYAQSSDNASVTSAYIYGGTYGSTNQMSGNFDSSQLKIVGLAEIINVSDASLTSSNIVNSKGDLA